LKFIRVRANFEHLPTAFTTTFLKEQESLFDIRTKRVTGNTIMQTGKVLLRSESPSGKCAKLHKSNNRDHMP